MIILLPLLRKLSIRSRTIVGAAVTAAGLVVIAVAGGPAVFLVYLLYVALAVADHSHGGAVVAVLLVLFVAELPFARAVAFVMCVHITAVLVGRVGLRAASIVIALASPRPGATTPTSRCSTSRWTESTASRRRGCSPGRCPSAAA